MACLCEMEGEAKQQARRRSTRTEGRRTELAVAIAFGCPFYLTFVQWVRCFVPLQCSPSRFL
jgi:hypothetical protein